MSKVGNAAASVAASMLVLGGAYAAEIVENHSAREAKIACYDQFEGDEQAACLEDVGVTDLGYSEMLKGIGIIGVAGCGYIGYKTLKRESETTGIIDDVMG